MFARMVPSYQDHWKICGLSWTAMSLPRICSFLYSVSQNCNQHKTCRQDKLWRSLELCKAALYLQQTTKSSASQKIVGMRNLSLLERLTSIALSGYMIFIAQI